MATSKKSAADAATREAAIVPEEEVSFAKALKMLEETVKSLESGELSLEDSLTKFEEGIRLARKLESVLDRAEQKVKEILNPAGGSEEPKESKESKE